MSLKPKDLIHGGFYRHTDPENGSIYQYDAVKCGFKATDQAHFQGFTDYGAGLLGFFEPIPLDPQILEEWEIATYQGTDDNGAAYSIPCGHTNLLIYWDGKCFAWLFKQTYIKKAWPRMRKLPFFHELQRLYLALTDKELEGGPK